MKIVVYGQKTNPYLDDNTHPSLVVNYFKPGSGVSGAIGYWVEVGTAAFADLTICIN